MYPGQEHVKSKNEAKEQVVVLMNGIQDTFALLPQMVHTQL